MPRWCHNVLQKLTMRRGGRGTCIHRFCSNLPITRRFSDGRIYFYQTARNFWENLTTGPHFGFWSGMRWKPVCSWPRCTSRQAASQTLSPWKQWDCFDNFQASWCSRWERWKPKRWWAEWSRGPGWSSSRAAAGWRAPNNQQRLYFINKNYPIKSFTCPALPHLPGKIIRWTFALNLDIWFSRLGLSGSVSRVSDDVHLKWEKWHLTMCYRPVCRKKHQTEGPNSIMYVLKWNGEYHVKG